MENNFSSALYPLPFRLRSVLEQIPNQVKTNVQEIRLRSGLPLALTIEGETVFVEKTGGLSFIYKSNLVTVTQKEIDDCFLELCGHSVFAHEEEIKNGFIAMNSGCRAGICGNLNKEGFVNEITSINIRIAHQIKGAANQIISNYLGKGMLICGPPGSGKTTVLRDMVRQLSQGYRQKNYRVCVIDSRYEISGAFNKNYINDLGYSYDLIITPNRAKGIEIALRTMFPEIIAFDEIGTMDELRAVQSSFHSGVSIITTAHLGSVDELLSRNITEELIKCGAISQVALLPRMHTGKIQIFSVNELLTKSRSENGDGN